MTFERHLFISYAHLDNQPITPEQKGWVDRFHASLESMLSARLAQRAAIWRDQKLSGNDLYSDEIVAQFPKTAILVSVLTPAYLKSPWCMKEAQEFCRLASQYGGVRLENKSRVIKVVKMPVQSETALPPLYSEMEGYRFYTKIGDKPLELDPSYGRELAEKYNLELAILAYDVAEVLRKIEAAAAGGPLLPDAAAAKPTVYLAQCSSDMRESRHALETELRIHGNRVLPDKQFPIEEAQCAAEVASLIGQCSLSIHLVGTGYGFVPNGPSEKSVVVLQNELAVQRSKTTGLPRLIWLPEGTTSPHIEQQRFIEMLHKDADVQFGADLVTGDLETLKSTVHAALRKLENPNRAESVERTGGFGGKLIFVICDRKDRDAVLPLRKYLTERGFQVRKPVFEGNARTIRQTNQKLYSQCDSAILFYGVGDEAWKAAVESELRKTKCSGKPVYIYLAEPETADKRELIEVGERNVINGLGGFSEAPMGRFFNALH
jgi:hypothetical protein